MLLNGATMVMGLQVGRYRPLREMKDMEKWLAVVEKDRKRAMDVLEGASGTYGKLLTLFLKEVRGMKK